MSEDVGRCIDCSNNDGSYCTARAFDILCDSDIANELLLELETFEFY